MSNKDQVKQDEKKQDDKKEKSSFGDLFKKKESEKSPTLEGVATLKIFAKNTILFRRISKELKLINKGFENLAKLEGVKTVSKIDSASKFANMFKPNEVDKEIKKTEKVKRKKNTKKKVKGFLKNTLDSIIEGLLTLIAGIAFALFMNKDAILSYIGSLGGVEGIISMGIESLKTAFNDFFGSTNWGEIFVEEASKIIEFLTFGLVTKDDAAKVLNSIGDFISPVTSRIGEFLGGLGNWVADKLIGIGRSLDKNVLGIEPSATKPGEKEKPIDPYAGAVEQLDVLDADIEALTWKRNKLKELIAKRDEQKRGGKKVEPIVLPPAPPPPKYRSKKSVFTPTEQPTQTAATPAVSGGGGGGATPVVAQTEAPGAPSSNLESLVKKETPKVVLQFDPAFENLIVKAATDFKSAMNRPIQINSGFRTGDYQKDLWFNLKGNNPGYLARVGREGGFDNLTGSKQDAMLAAMRSGVAAPSKKSGIVIEIDKYGEQPGQVVGKKVIPPTAGKGHEAGRAVDISPADLENKSFLEKMGFKDTDSYLKSIGLWRSLLKSPAKETWHVETIGGISHTDSVQTPIDKPSAELAAEQRNQSKPKNPTVINAGVTNNTVVESTQLRREVPA